MDSKDSAGGFNDLRGKVVLVTGATSGLGYSISLELLRGGATVYLAARNERKAAAAIGDFRAEDLSPGNGKPIFHKLELDDPHGVKTSAEEFLRRESRLDVLINSAACVGKDYALGPIGIQDIVTINHISPFLFTKLLLPLMKKTAQKPGTDVRIVNITSEAYKFVPPMRFEEIEDLNGPTMENSYTEKFNRYALSKLMNILWTKELARRLDSEVGVGGAGTGILCLSMDPGPYASETVINATERFPWPFSTTLRRAYELFYRPPAAAAVNVVIAAARRDLRREIKKYHGAYLPPFAKDIKPRREVPNHDETVARNLWTLTEGILADEGL